MKNNWTTIEITSENMRRHLFLPSDLFIIKFKSIEKEIFSSFIKFIENLSKSQGWQFSSHYMHSEPKVNNSFPINVNMLESLYPYLDTLKSLKVRVYN